MSRIFEALQGLESERVAVNSLPDPEEIEFLRCAERKIAPKPEAAFSGWNDEDALLFLRGTLPTFDRDRSTADSNPLTPRRHVHQAPPLPRPVNFASVDDSLTRFRTQRRELHNQVAEQDASSRRAEDRLRWDREATDSKSRQNQKGNQELKREGNKVSFVAAVAIGLAAASVVMNIAQQRRSAKVIVR